MQDKKSCCKCIRFCIQYCVIVIVLSSPSIITASICYFGDCRNTEEDRRYLETAKIILINCILWSVFIVTAYRYFLNEEDGCFDQLLPAITTTFIGLVTLTLSSVIFKVLGKFTLQNSLFIFLLSIALTIGLFFLLLIIFLFGDTSYCLIRYLVEKKWVKTEENIALVDID